MTWVPAFAFVALACFFFQKAVRRNARQSWSWGRGGGGVPVSRWGYACWAATFLSIAFIVHASTRPPVEAVAAFFVCFACTLAAGFFDTRRHERTRRAQERARGSSG